MKTQMSIENNIIVVVKKKSPLCLCECGKRVKNEKSKYCQGHSTRTKETQDKMKITCVKNFGVENSFKSKKIQEKIKQTHIKNYGVEYPNQSEQVKEKKKQTCLKKFGETTNLKSEETKNKKIISFLKKYGVENPSQSEIIKEKKKFASRKHYNTDYTLQAKEVRDKSKQTNLKNIGFEFPGQSKEIQNKSKKTMLRKYGVDHFSKTPQGKLISRTNMIKLIMSNYKDGSKFSPTEGIQERLCFDELQLSSPYPLLKNQTYIGYFPDRYVKESNLIIEFYENWHNNNWSKQHDIIRQEELIKYLNCKFFIIKEKEWKENKEQVINQFKEIVQCQKELLSVIPTSVGLNPIS